MSDDEVKTWLSKSEAWEFDRALRAYPLEIEEMKGRTYIHGPWESTIAMARSLAETRKALADVFYALDNRDDFGNYDSYGVDEVRDFLTTMPRPK